MGLFAGMGRRADAVKQYQICREAFQRELGTVPGPEIEALYAALMSEERGGETSSPAPHLPAPTERDPRPVIAVLPFDNFSNADTVYFADGVTEGVITGLSHFHSIQVIARGSTFRYRGSDISEKEISEALGAQYLVRGSALQNGSALRMTVQLIDGERGMHLWAHTYNRQLDQVFEVLDDITATVVSTLVGRVSDDQIARARTAPTESLAAYDYLLQGQYHHHLFSPKDCDTCIDLFSRAIEQDPGYAASHAWLACGLGQAMVFRPDDVSDLLSQSRVAVKRGLALNPNDSECHRVQAQICMLDGDLEAAIRHQERSLFLNPNDDRSVCSMGELLSFAGQHEEAEAWVRKAIRLNPYHPQRYWTHLVRPLMHQEKHDEAMDTSLRIGQPRTDDLVVRVVLCSLLGEPERAREALDDLLAKAPDFDRTTFADGLPYKNAQDRSMILDALEKVMD